MRVLAFRHVPFEGCRALAPVLGICLGAQLIAKALGAVLSDLVFSRLFNYSTARGVTRGPRIDILVG